MIKFRYLLASLPLSLGIALSCPASADIATAEAAIAAKDYDAAISALEPLVASGDGYAKWKLAELYLAGHGGKTADGIALLQQAAAAGEPEAQARLGVLYAKGQGVTQSDVEAYKWLSLAVRGAAPGISRTLAETNQDVVGQRMTAEQRAEAIAASQSASLAYLPETTPIAAPEVAAPAAVVAPEPPPSSNALSSSFRIQLASVPNEGDVAGEWTRLKKRIGAPLANLELHVEQADLGSKGIYHRLQAGPFATRQEAVDACSTVKSSGADCLVVGP
ncbi:SPOR domain-containing protein [Dongia sp.]|uniref:SPOR domain-containing protein n=1 Tax=Dongia sp. TaxID=1977262 RepID=UPI0035B2CB5E